MKLYLLYSLLVSSIIQISAQQQITKPKLVVGIVIDQMRYDYLLRFKERFSNDGFNRLLNEGFEFKNHHFNYMPTYTGPGHASIFTGTTPNNHGIIANNWYDKFNKQMTYCVNDISVSPLGTVSNNEKMSPHHMLTMSFADANRIHTQFKGKTIGISLKDRGAILPAGHAANRAYWFRGKKEGKWVSSDYYGPQLPNWVINFNKKEPAQKYLKEWNTLYPISTYNNSGADLNNYEKGFAGKATATFPYDLKNLSALNSDFDIIKKSPYGNQLVTEFALAALKNEKLGVDNYPDVLTISYSSTDYIGHNFGVNSVEIEDTYIRLDLELAKLLNHLDDTVGKNTYTIFLTADHGAVHVPQFLKDHNIPAHYFKQNKFEALITDFLKQKFNSDKLIANYSNNQIFLNYEVLKGKELNRTTISNELQHFISQIPHIQYVFTRDQLVQNSNNNAIGPLVQNGFHQRLSGDIAYVFTPSTIVYSKKGSTHGSPQAYDTHVPLLFYGKGIRNGATFNKTTVIDIAPTCSALLQTANPNGCTGNVLDEAFLKQKVNTK